MTKMKFIIITGVILLPIFIFWLGDFHFSKHYFIAQNISTEKEKRIKCGFWKAYESVLGDILVCNQCNCKINQGILYINEEPKAKVISLIRRFPSCDYILTIQSLEGQKTGSYISK